MQLWLDRYQSSLAELFVVTDEAGCLRALEFADLEPRMQRFLRRDYGAYQLTPGAAPKTIIQALDEYFEGNFAALDRLQLATEGTPFQRDVWRVVRAIPAGETATYGQIAARVGRPAASRAVGAANGANPIPIVVPCHRVIGSSGALTGYGGGLPRKHWLLQHERSPAVCQAG